MGIPMLIYLLFMYFKYVTGLDFRHSKYFPAVLGIILAGITESALALFSINTVFLILLIIGLRKRNEPNYRYCSRI
jgi:hypothetical protein